jgi:acetyltransferase-like isoleucine patch superfamily enzyme
MRGVRERVGRARARLRFALWTRRLRKMLRAHGAELDVDAPHGATMTAPPIVDISPWGAAGAARTVLRLGAEVTIGRGVVLELFPGGTNVIELGDRVVLHDQVRLQVRNGAIRLGADSRVRSHAVLKADGEIVAAGQNEISYFTVVHCAGRVELGWGTGLAERVSLVDSDHPADGTDDDFYRAPLLVDPVVLGPNVFVAAGAIITRGTSVGRNSVVAAGSVLTGARAFAPGSLIAGVPARVVRSLRAEDQLSSSER